MSRGDAIGLSLVLAIGAAALFLGRTLFVGPDDPPTGDHSTATSSPEPDAPPVRREVIDVGSYTSVAPSTPTHAIAARLSELNDSAIAALEEGRLEDAVALFEECREGEPDEPVFASNLAEALVRLARARYATDVDLSGPIELLRRATALAPARGDLGALLERWEKSAETEKDFWTDETEHFRLSYDGNRSELLHRGHDIVTNALEYAYSELAQVFGYYPVANVGDPKIRVVIYQREEFSELTGIGHWAGGVYDGVVRIPLTDLDEQREELERVLRHELVHAFVKALGGSSVPAWLNEGLAQWHERLHLDERAAGVKRARERLAGKELFTLEELRGSLAGWSEREKIELGYAEALALVAYLERWYGERVLYEMVAGCGEGHTCEETFLGRTGVELEAVVEDLKGTL